MRNDLEPLFAKRRLRWLALTRNHWYRKAGQQQTYFHQIWLIVRLYIKATQMK